MKPEHKELLLRAKKAILKEPKQFTMGAWFTKYPEERESSFEYTIPNCGTAACIAGWVITLSKENQNPLRAREAIVDQFKSTRVYVDEETLACRILGLPRYKAMSLFYVANWPNELIEKWEVADSPEERAQIAAERIDQFISEHDTVTP